MGKPLKNVAAGLVSAKMLVKNRVIPQGPRQMCPVLCAAQVGLVLEENKTKNPVKIERQWGRGVLKLPYRRIIFSISFSLFGL